MRGEPFDIAWTGGYTADYPDPSDFLDLLFDGRTIQATNNIDISYFNDPAYNRRLDAAAKLTGAQRYRAYQALDAYLTRTAAPAVPLWTETEQDFYSARIGPALQDRPTRLRRRLRRTLPQTQSLTTQPPIWTTLAGSGRPCLLTRQPPYGKGDRAPQNRTLLAGSRPQSVLR